MIRLFLIFLLSFSLTFIWLWKAEAAPPVPSMEQLIQSPKIIEYQQKPHAVFDYGGLRFLFIISKMPTPFPSCNAVQTIGEELMVVRSDPFGYVFFVIKNPIAFQTNHSPIWEELVRESCEGCE
jgi:hypothetical protein